MKRAALCILALLVGSTALAPFVASSGGLNVIVLITPQGRAAGQTVDVNLEAYVNGVATDLESLSVTAGATDINFTNVSAGKYHATLMINSGDLFGDSLFISGSADVAGLSETVFDTYLVGGSSPSGWDVTLRSVAGGQLFTNVAPGSSVVLEARSYLNGQLTDGGPVNMSLMTASGMDFGATGAESPLTTTKTADGVYQATVQVPATIDVTKIFQVEAWLGSNITGPQESTVFFAHPFAVQSYAESTSATSAVLKVLVGSATAVAGANITLSGMAITMGFPPSIVMVGPFTATTDATGKATVSPTWSASTTVTTWFLNVTSGGKLTTTLVLLAPQASSGWTPDPPIGVFCEVKLQTDPSGFHPGQNVNLRFRVTNNGTAVASTSVFRYAYRDGASATTVAGNVTTDASGTFAMDYAIPANWTFDDKLIVSVDCPNGIFAGVEEVQGGSSNPFTTGQMTVSASGRLGGPVQVTATYTGTNALTGAVAICAIVPGSQSNIAGLGLAAGGLSAPMTRTGSTFTGSVTVPAWMGEGNYTAVVFVSNVGATSTTSDQTMEGNMTTIHLTPQGSTGGNNNGTTGGGFLPGFEAPAALGAVGATAALLVVGRRRRAA